MIFLPFFYMSLCRSWLEKVGILRTLLQSSTPTAYLTLGYTLTVSHQLKLQNLTEFITKDEDFTVIRGGFGNIWKCTYRMGRERMNVAVKSVLVCTAEQGDGVKKAKQRIEREIRIWALLGVKHVNILPLYGYTYGFGPLPALVSPWSENGDLAVYVRREYAKLSMVTRFNILKDVAAGLQYLHSKSIAHGDLTGPNVLIRHDGTACLADFGLSLVYFGEMDVSNALWSSSLHGNIRWMAPERFEVLEDGLPVHPSKQSDIYSFGGIMLLVLTGKIPYHHVLYEPAIIRIILSGSVKPERARYVLVPDKYWEFIEECWSTNIQHRPPIERVVQMVRDELGLIRAGAHA